MQVIIVSDASRNQKFVFDLVQIDARKISHQCYIVVEACTLELFPEILQARVLVETPHLKQSDSQLFAPVSSLLISEFDPLKSLLPSPIALGVKVLLSMMFDGEAKPGIVNIQFQRVSGVPSQLAKPAFTKLNSEQSLCNHPSQFLSD